MKNTKWIKCKKCEKKTEQKDLAALHYCCNYCGSYFSMDAESRLQLITDEDSFMEWKKGGRGLKAHSFPEYRKKLEKERKETGMWEAALTGVSRIHDYKCAIIIIDGEFFMGSIGQVAGEKVASTIEKAINKKLPLVIFISSAGARLQEGIVSLLQAVKINSLLKRHSDAGLFSISVITDPTIGGSTASFVMMADIILAEPGAFIGFAGSKVRAQSNVTQFPDTYQKSEFLYEMGFIDLIVEREELRNMIGTLLKLHGCPM